MPIGSAPVLGMLCGCGAHVERRCEDVAAIPSTAHDLIELGWGYDERGFVRCPDCRDGRDPKVEQGQTPEQGRLL